MRRDNRRNKTRKYPIIIIIALLLLGTFSLLWTKKNAANASNNSDTTLTPIIMIPGSGADNSALDGLIATVDQRYKENHSVLKVTVNTDNSLTYTGHIQPKDKHPYIVVGFENSQDGFENIKKQAKWFNIAFRDLQRKYHFHTFNAFGHSNGSLIWTYFLEDDFKQTNTKIKHLMTIGAPFNLEETNSDDHTEMLDQLIDGRKNLPKNLSYYSVAGTKQYANDGIVPLSSVDSGKYIYQDQIKHYMFITLTGTNAEHSDMLTNAQFITLFHQFISKVPAKTTNQTKK